MKSVWELGGNCTLSQIVTQCMKHEKIWQLQTVTTFLKHLEFKNYVRPYKDGRFLHYEILVQEKKYKKISFQKFLNFWYHGKIEHFLQDLLHGELLTEKEIEQIKKIFHSIKMFLSKKTAAYFRFINKKLPYCIQ